MPTEVNGLPAHILLVHAVVVVVPLAALLLLASAWWPAARRKLGFVTPLVALLALVLVPVTTHAGEWLRARVPATPLIERHAELGDSLLPWVTAMFLIAAAVWYVHNGAQLSGRWGSGVRRMQLARAGAGRDTGVDISEGSGTATLTTAPPRTDVRTMIVAALATVLAVGSVVQVVRIGESGSKAVWQGNVSSQPRTDSGNG